MPYITREAVSFLNENSPTTKGELNYLITELMVQYLKDNGKNYQNISDVIAAAQDAADEMKRRVLAPHEEAKKNDSNNVDPYEGL